MKKIMSYLFTVFTLFGFNFAFANECETAGKVRLSGMKFIGEDLTTVLSAVRGGKETSCRVVKARTDDSARALCGDKTAALNPGNPQYVGKDAGYGTRGDNNLGYYFCVQLNKKGMCEHMIEKKRSVMDIRWVSTGSGGRNNGDCKCKRKGESTAEEIECPAETKSLETAATTGCTVVGSEKGVDGKCHCLVGGKEVATGGTCEQESPPQITENVDDRDLEECVADLKAAKVACSDKGKAAIDKCSKEAPEVNKNISEAQRVLSIGLDAVIAKNAGTGALNACAKMGAAGTTVIEALSFLRENCKKELDSCKKGCEDVAALSKKTDKEYADECKAKFMAATPPKSFTTAHETRLNTLVGEQRDLGNNAEKFCTGDVEKADGQLDNFLQDLALSVQKADICKCQLTAGSVNTVNCETINNPLTCIQNINQPGCSFSSVGCSPGSTIAGCRNPISAVNASSSGVGMPASGFAGPGFSSGGSTGAGGKVGLGKDDFGGLYDEARPAGSGTSTVAESASPFGTTQPGGSPGGGADIRGSDSGGTGSGEGGDDKGGLSGFFQNTKAGIASLFGGGADNKGSAVKKPDNKAYKNDVNGFRPKATVRGMANSNEFGSKNRDIWKTMNERYNDQYHTFITVENPPK